MLIEKQVYNKGDILYHATHGLCRVKGVVERSILGESDFCYYLEPERIGKVNARFFVALNRIHEAGFHRPLTADRAKKILDYLKKGHAASGLSRKVENDDLLTLSQKKTPRAYADILLLLVEDKDVLSNRKKSRLFRYAADILAHELALALNISVKRANLRMWNSMKVLHTNARLRGVLDKIN